ncbi:MAG: nucleoid-associated protein, YbaB/EbfC family [Planctomycetota bacterium]|nr:MAG: nucleoid-associated protein, YbaB/EbfC family [Planctomycetota bacterium]
MDFKHLLEQAQNFQHNLEQIEKDMEGLRTSGTAGGGAAQAVVNGQGAVLELELSPELVATGDAVQIAEVVKAALRQAQDAARAEREQRRGQLLGDLKLPDL